MEIWIETFEQTARLLLRIAPVMFLSLIGVEVLMQLGLMKKLEPLGKPLAKASNLPSESALSFLAGIGSIVAAHTMIAQFHQDGRVTGREMVLTGVLNTAPFHFKETLTFQLPVVLPLLGSKLCLIYITAFWLAGFLKLAFVVIYGKLKIRRRPQDRSAFDDLVCDPAVNDCIPRSFLEILKDAFRARIKLFRRMILLLSGVTFVVQYLANSGILKTLDRVIAPAADLFGLPPVVIAPISVYIFSPTAGVAYMSNLIAQQLVTEYQAIVALLAGSFIMIPATRLRGTLPRYAGYFGFKYGAVVCALTMGLTMAARGIVLALVLLFYE